MSVTDIVKENELLYRAIKADKLSSVIFYGPPGTGKSQTITGLIINLLARGKTVLFVAEKMAALSVVQKRLAKIGLDPFCLELHSNKTEKGKFYEQIKAALAVPETHVPCEWNQVVADFEKNRRELDDYIVELHKQYPNGLTAYNCFSRAMQHGTDVRVDFPEINCLSQDRAHLQTRLILNRFDTDKSGREISPRPVYQNTGLHKQFSRISPVRSAVLFFISGIIIGYTVITRRVKTFESYLTRMEVRMIEYLHEG